MRQWQRNRQKEVGRQEKAEESRNREKTRGHKEKGRERATNRQKQRDTDRYRETQGIPKARDGSLLERQTQR